MLKSLAGNRDADGGGMMVVVINKSINQLDTRAFL